MISENTSSHLRYLRRHYNAADDRAAILAESAALKRERETIPVVTGLARTQRALRLDALTLAAREVGVILT
jgi:hypothetical protein